MMTPSLERCVSLVFFHRNGKLWHSSRRCPLITKGVIPTANGLAARSSGLLGGTGACVTPAVGAAERCFSTKEALRVASPSGEKSSRRLASWGCPYSKSGASGGLWLGWLRVKGFLVGADPREGSCWVAPAGGLSLELLARWRLLAREQTA